MTTKLDHLKEDKSDDLDAEAREAARTSIETENQLSSNLITVTLAFVALIATAISTSNVLYVVVDFQKIIILSAMIVFCLSILAGLINYFHNMTFHHQTSALKGRLADRIEDASTHQEVERINHKLDSVSRPLVTNQYHRSRILLILQIICVIIGLALTIVFVSSLLFYTATREDYTEDLPIYEEIMQDQAEASAE